MKKSLLVVLLAVAMVIPAFAAKGDVSVNAKLGLGLNNSVSYYGAFGAPDDVSLDLKLNICDAPAGVGKSLLALTAGLFLLKNGNVSKILIIVPTVEASEATKIGLLPGSIEEKIKPFQMATISTLEKILKLSGNINYTEMVQQLINSGLIEYTGMLLVMKQRMLMYIIMHVIED